MDAISEEDVAEMVFWMRAEHERLTLNEEEPWVLESYQKLLEMFEDYRRLRHIDRIINAAIDSGDAYIQNYFGRY